ncbi:uncharacterized protein LOC117811039 [Notolabrus celidotus]|uniref:uncharacterized protein LOC117811039 n=1 Tax=Notolabrus celidotus TaxID=1203425 RepID=UPI00148FA1F5|nr:uncharacterized protein LOC117811039 [Notolabrus celidotus]
MPPFTVDDFQKILQKIAVLETKMHRIEVNVEVNGLCGNDATLPWGQSSRHVPANTRLVSPNNDTPKQEDCAVGTSWNTLGARPKDKTFPTDMRERITGRAQRPEICDAPGWSALSSRRSAASTPLPRRKQPWTAVKATSKSKPVKETKIHLENRFAPLSQDPDSPSQDLRSPVSSKTKGRYETKSITDKILDIVADHTTVKSLILHTGALDVLKQQSELPWPRTRD